MLGIALDFVSNIFHLTIKPHLTPFTTVQADVYSKRSIHTLSARVHAHHKCSYVYTRSTRQNPSAFIFRQLKTRSLLEVYRHLGCDTWYTLALRSFSCQLAIACLSPWQSFYPVVILRLVQIRNQAASAKSILEYLYGALYDTGEPRLDGLVSFERSGWRRPKCMIVPPALVPSLSSPTSLS